MRRKKKSWCYDYSVEVRLVISVPNNYPGDWCVCVCVSINMCNFHDYNYQPFPSLSECLQMHFAVI